MGEYQIKVPLNGEAEITAVHKITRQNFNAAGGGGVFCTGVDHTGGGSVAAFNAGNITMPFITAVKNAMTEAGILNVGGSIRPIGAQTRVVTLARR